jgi:hypothetical protein
MKTLIVALGALLALGVLATGSAHASIPDSHGVYTACVLKVVGTIRLIDTDDPMQRCSGLEVRRTWSQTGKQGPAGQSVSATALPSGDAICPAGGTVFRIAGVTVGYACNGARGPEGRPGLKGDQGLRGIQGPQGVKGDTGDPGRPGASGRDGISVTSVALDVGDAHCPDGGVQLTSGTGVQFVCNGASGESLPMPDFVGEGGKRAASFTTSVAAKSLQAFTVSCGAGQTIVGPIVQVPSNPDPRFNYDATLKSAEFAADRQYATVTFDNSNDLVTSARVDYLCQVPGPLPPGTQSSERAGWFGMNPSQGGTYVSCPGVGRPLSNVYVIPDPQSPYQSPPTVTISYLLEGYEALVTWNPSSGWSGDFGLAFDCWSFPGSGLSKLELTRRTFGVGIPLATTFTDVFGCSSPDQLIVSGVSFQAATPLTTASAARSGDGKSVAVQLAHGENHGVSATIEFYCGKPLP